jgi:dolichyl-phosphate-mannose--protein O-mannosyl transferase
MNDIKDVADIKITEVALPVTGAFKFDRIGGPYDATVPVFAMRLVPAFFGALLSSTVYKLMQELGSSQPAALLAAVLIVLGRLNIIKLLLYKITPVNFV